MSTCPCELIVPCSKSCSCATPALAGLCGRCVAGGDAAQRVVYAQFIADALDAARTRARWADGFGPEGTGSPCPQCGRPNRSTESVFYCPECRAQHNTPEAKEVFLAEMNAHQPCADHLDCHVCQGNAKLCSAHRHHIPGCPNEDVYECRCWCHWPSHGDVER